MANPKTQDLTRKIRENEAQRRQSEAAEAARAGWRWPSPDEAERRLSGQAGALTGLALGVPRGAFDMARDGVNAANFVGRLMDPSDAYHSPAGQAAWDDVFRAGKRGFDYLTSHWADPSKIGSDFRHVSVGSNVYLHPGAAPLGPSARGEFANQLQTGMNVGEGVFGVGASAELPNSVASPNFGRSRKAPALPTTSRPARLNGWWTIWRSRTQEWGATRQFRAR